MKFSMTVLWLKTHPLMESDSWYDVVITRYAYIAYSMHWTETVNSQSGLVLAARLAYSQSYFTLHCRPRITDSDPLQAQACGSRILKRREFGLPWNVVFYSSELGSSLFVVGVQTEDLIYKQQACEFKPHCWCCRFSMMCCLCLGNSRQ